jgi:hypothetical protein
MCARPRLRGGRPFLHALAPAPCVPLPCIATAKPERRGLLVVSLLGGVGCGCCRRGALVAELGRLKEENVAQLAAAAAEATARLAVVEANRQAAVDGFIEEMRVLNEEHAEVVARAARDAGAWRVGARGWLACTG